MADNTNPRISTDVKIKNVPNSTRDKLFNVAAHVGIDVSALIKANLKHIFAQFPEHYQNPRKRDD